jgi:hypothetical protein
MYHVAVVLGGGGKRDNKPKTAQTPLTPAQRQNHAKATIREMIRKTNSKHQNILLSTNFNNNTKNEFRELMALRRAALRSMNEPNQSVSIRNVDYAVTYVPMIEFRLTSGGKNNLVITDANLHNLGVLNKIKRRNYSLVRGNEMSQRNQRNT